MGGVARKKAGLVATTATCVRTRRVAAGRRTSRRPSRRAGRAAGKEPFFHDSARGSGVEWKQEQIESARPSRDDLAPCFDFTPRPRGDGCLLLPDAVWHPAPTGQERVSWLRRTTPHSPPPTGGTPGSTNSPATSR